MFRKTLLGTAIAALVATAGIPAARASNEAFVFQTGAPVWWGATGIFADLILYYDFGATGPLTLEDGYLADVQGDRVSQKIVTCGTATAGGHVLQPGDVCWLRGIRSNASVYGSFVLTNGTTTPVSPAHVRASLEIMDPLFNVLNHVELR
jgi:hypothetical protein